MPTAEAQSSIDVAPLDPGPELPRVAWAPVLAVAGIAGLALLIASRNYGYFFDEAYFVVAGRDHLAWGYFDQPALIPALAAAMNHLAPDSLTALRLPVTVAAAVGIVLTALLARELGGGRGAQVLAAIGYALSTAVVLCHWLATYSLDPVFWTAIVFLVVRWARLHAEGRPDDRLLLGAGLVTVLSLQTKFLVPALWVALVLCALVFRPRRLVGRPLLWVGGLVAALATVPNLIWQQQNSWPYTHMSEVVAAEFPGVGRFLWDSAAGAGLAVGLPLLLIGFPALLFGQRFRTYRFAGAALALVFLAYLVSSGRSYYTAGLYALPIAAGAVVVAGLSKHVVVRVLVAVALTAGLAMGAAAVPVYPRSWAERIPDTTAILTARAFIQSDTMIGDLSDAVAAAYNGLPAEQRSQTAILAESYPFAAAVDVNRGATGLPRAYSPHRAYYYFGAPPETATAVLFLGTPPPQLTAAFTDSEPVIPDLATLLTGRTVPWTVLWPQLRAQ
ncbi:glycosyltransferase family 39 protein [Nocardia sp. NPDC049149]|uniref:glycosyltransferase family 39 protein n=1 Tax=Nocardia sp. NPDC049149 TaxID=3364315 RepID=UPI00371842F1